MAYEMKFYVGIKHKIKGIDNPDYNYFQIIASYDYAADSDLGDFVYKYDSAKVFGFFTQSDKEEILDKYGDKFKEIPIEDMLKYLSEHPDYEYRRYLPFKTLLEGFNLVKKQFDDEDNDLILINYGH